MAGQVITQEEWLAEIERLEGESRRDGFTSEELVEFYNNLSPMKQRSRYWILAKLKILVKRGAVVVGRRRELRIDGVPIIKPTYKLKEKPKAAKKPKATKRKA